MNGEHLWLDLGLLDSRKSPSTLKVYVAAIAAQCNTVDGVSLGTHKLVSVGKCGFCNFKIDKNELCCIS